MQRIPHFSYGKREAVGKDLRITSSNWTQEE